jgi:ABC-type transport system involved in multi-copper enzyme maturation permease subunit
MTTGTVSEPRSGAGTEDEAGPGGFGWLVRSEWTKFHSVRGWIIGLIIGALLTVLLGLFISANGKIACGSPGVPLRTGKACLPYVPHGPGGEVVTDQFNFAHQPLTGNGSMTVRVTGLTGAGAGAGNQAGPQSPGANLGGGLDSWSKAGIIIKQNLHQGSAYAAMMVTGSNGVRMQYNYTGDIAGLPGNVSAASPRWLRLTRSGDTITGYDSADGRHWATVGTVELSGLPATVQVGMFATSPTYTVTSTSFGGGTNNSGPTQATGTFDDVTMSGTPAGGRWTDTAVGGAGGPGGQGSAAPGTAGFTAAKGKYTVTGSGDIAPVIPGPGSSLPTVTIEQSLTGVFIGLIPIVVVAAMFFTAEYRRGLIRTTLAATPARGQVLAAKAIVAFGAAFVTGLVACTVAIVMGVPQAENTGAVLLTVPVLTEIRVVVGTAALLGVAAVFAVALGAVLRRSAAAITLAIVTVVMPFLLSALNVFPSGVGTWLLRVTPAAGLAIQQSVPHYPQVTALVSVANGGIYPLQPYAGFAVVCAWAAAALVLAAYLLRRRDA